MVGSDAWLWLSRPDAMTGDGLWVRWVEHVEANGSGWSSTERRQYDVVAALTAGRPLDVLEMLDGLNEWAQPILSALVSWATVGRMQVVQR